MPFIGKSPQVGAFQLIDSITTSATDTYALTVSGSAYVPESARNLIVSLNGVTQAPESAYTVSGSNIVFASALTASDVIDYILVIGDAVDIGTPSDNTVGDAQLKPSLNLSSKTLTFANDQISGDVINGGTISNFTSTGIDDNATSTALTVTDSGIAATLTTAAQPNITSVGTLTGFTSTGIDDNATSTAITIDSSQRVGIGTVSPGVALDVNGDSNTQLRLTASDSLGASMINFGDQANVAVGRIIYSHINDSFSFKTNNVNDRLVIDSNGNLGIGTNTPISLGAGTQGITIEGSAGGFTHYQYNAANTGYVVAASDALSINTFTGKNLVLGTEAVERMRIDSSGNLLVGGTFFAQAGSCSIDQDGNIMQVSASGVASSSLFGAISGVSNGFQIQSTAANKHIYTFLNGPNVALKINDSGNVGIGTTSPRQRLTFGSLTATATATPECIDLGGTYSNSAGSNLKLKLYEDGSITHGFGVSNASTDYVTSVTGTHKFFQSTNERMRIDASGNLLVGTTSDLSTASDSGVMIQNSSSGTVGRITIGSTYAGSSTAISFRNSSSGSTSVVGSIVSGATTTSYNTSSDVRLKENIVDAPAGNIDAIRVRSFDWKADGSHQTYGMVAQELVDVAPEAVSQGETEDDVWGVDYSKLVPMMIKEIQDLKAEVAALKGA